MKNFVFPLIAACIMLLSSCSAIEGIFKAGYFVGIFVVIAILAVIIFIFSKLRS